MIDFRLIKIEIFNFACYYGKNTLNFNEESKNNIFLFKLPNGYGKTSLFHAIKWGFYGEEIEYFKDSDKVEVKDFLNDRLDKSKDLCYVEITFEYGKDVYILKRIFKPRHPIDFIKFRYWNRYGFKDFKIFRRKK